jgi:hypothetical protein
VASEIFAQNLLFMDAEMHMHSQGVQSRTTVIRIGQRKISGQW